MAGHQGRRRGQDECSQERGAAAEIQGGVRPQWNFLLEWQNPDRMRSSKVWMVLSAATSSGRPWNNFSEDPHFVRMGFPASWVEDVPRDWVFRCDSSASFITVPRKAVHTPAPEIPLAVSSVYPTFDMTPTRVLFPLSPYYCRPCFLTVASQVMYTKFTEHLPWLALDVLLSI